MDLDNMTDEQIIMGLMRGEKASFKAGYSAEAAVMTLESLRGPFNEEFHAEIRAFARGFAHGLNEDNSINNPAKVSRRPVRV